MGWSDTEQTAEACGHADRPTGVGAECEIAQAAGDDRSRPGRGPARHAIGRRGIERRTGEWVFAENPKRNLICRGLPNDGGTTVQQPLHDPGGACRDRMRPFPVRITGAGRPAGNIDQILDGEGQAGQRAGRLPGNGASGSRHEGVQMVHQVRSQIAARTACRGRDATISGVGATC